MKLKFHTHRYSSLGQFLESRDSFLASLDQQVHRQEQVARKKSALHRASELAMDEHTKLGTDGAECPQVEVAEFKPSMHNEFTLKTMLECGMHLGHCTAKWSPRMAPLIYGSRHGIHIIDLEKSLACLRQACQVVKELSKNAHATLLFVGCRPAIRRLVYECAMHAGQYYVNTQWTKGTLTNTRSVLGSQIALHHAIGADPHGPDHKPTMLVLLEWVDGAVDEAERCHIPVVAICDTDKDPSRVTYPIPANDDAFASVELVGRLLAKAAKEGREQARLKMEGKEQAIIDSASRFARDALDQLLPSLFH